MTPAFTSNASSSPQIKGEPNSDTRIYGKLEGSHAIGDTETMLSDSGRRTRRSSTRNHREKSSPRLDTSARSESSLKSKSKTETRKKRTKSEIATSTAGLSEMTRGKSDLVAISRPGGVAEKAMCCAVSSDKTKSSSGSPEKKTNRVSSDFIARTAESPGTKLSTSASKIITSKAGSPEKSKSRSKSSEKKVSQKSVDFMSSTAGSFEMTMGKSALVTISSRAGVAKTTMRESGSSEKTKSSSGSPENKTNRVSYMTRTAESSGKKLSTSASEIKTSTAGSSEKTKSRTRSSETKVSQVSADFATSTAGMSAKKMSRPVFRPMLEIMSSAAGSPTKKVSPAASEIITCTDASFDTTMKRLLSEIYTSRTGSSEKTKSSNDLTEKKKDMSACEKVKSRTGSCEKKKKKKKSKSVDPLGSSLRSAKRSIPIDTDALDSTHKERMGRKPSIRLGEKPKDVVLLTTKAITDEIPTLTVEDVGAWFFEKAAGFKDEVVTEPSLEDLEARRRTKQVMDAAKGSSRQHREARYNSISHVASIDVLIPKHTDTPISGTSFNDSDWVDELSKKSCLDLGACTQSTDVHKLPFISVVRCEGMESQVTRLSDNASCDIATRGTPKPQEITAKTDVKIRQDLDALRKLDRKLTSLLTLETQRRLCKVGKPRPTLDVLINQQCSDTPMSAISMDELLEGLVQESFLSPGSSAACLDVDDYSFAFDIEEAPGMRYATEKKRSQSQPSSRRSPSCEEGMSISHENETLQRRRTSRRSDSCKERVGSKPSATIFTEAEDCESYESPIRDQACTGNKVRMRKKATTARQEGRNPPSPCLDETRHSRQFDNDKQSKTRHKGKNSKSDQYYFDLHIPRRCDPPLSGISMSDDEWVEDLYTTCILD